MSSTVLVSKSAEVVVPRLGIVVEDPNLDGGIRDLDTSNIEPEIRMILSIAHVGVLLFLSAGR